MSRRLWWGLGILVVGVLLLAANLGYIRPFSVWGLWPIFLLWPALKFVFQGMTFNLDVELVTVRRRVQVVPSLGYRLIALWVAIGAGAQLLHNVNLIRYDWGDVTYWTLPLLLVGIGLALMLRPRDHMWRWTHGDKMRDQASGTSVFVGDLRFGSRPWVFKSPMAISLWAGDVDVDLTTAQFAPGDNFLALHAWAGEFNVRVPESIEVTVEAHCSAGQLQVFDERRDGIGCDLKSTRPARVPSNGYGGISGVGTGAETGTEPSVEKTRLFVGANLTFGDVRVR